MLPEKSDSAATPLQPTGQLGSLAAQDPNLPRWAAILLVVAVGWIVCGWEMGERGLWSAHEGRAAQNGQGILGTGTWALPTLMTGDVEYQKPPGYYWSVAVVSWLSGGTVTPWTTRLPATLAGIAGLVVVFSWGRWIGGTRTGLIAAAILVTTTRYAWLGRVGRIDMPLALLVLLATYAAFRMLNAPDATDPPERTWRTALRDRWWWTLYLSLGLGLLFKGPVVLPLVALPLVVAAGVHGWRDAGCRLQPSMGLLLTLCVGLPWYAYAAWKTEGEFFWQFFVYHNVERALGTTDTLKAGPIWFYVPRLVVDCFPWSLLLPAMYLTLWKQRTRFVRPASLRDRAVGFWLAWLITQFVFLSLVQFKRADYLLPVFPALALLMATWLEERSVRFVTRLTTQPMKNLRRRGRWIVVSAAALVAVSVPLLIWALVRFREAGLVDTLFGWKLLAKHLNETDEFMMVHVERLLREHWPLLLIALVVVAIGIWHFYVGWAQRKTPRLVAGLATPWLVCFLVQVHVVFPALDELRDMSRFGDEIRTLAGQDHVIHYFGKFDDDLVFYAGRPAKLMGRWSELRELGLSTQPEFVVMKRSHYLAAVASPNAVVSGAVAPWIPIADNRQTTCGEHRQPRILLTNRPAVLAELPQRVGTDGAER